MKRRTRLVWYLAGGMILALAMLAFSCTGTTPDSQEETPTQQVPAQGSDVEETVVEGSSESGSGETEDENETEVETEIESETAEPIPHTLAGRENCLMCHSETGVVPFPSSHVGRTNDTCTACHQPASGTSSGTEVSSGPPLIPHTLAGRDNCLMCHSETGVIPFPSDHTGRTNDICQGCHKPAS